MESSHTAELDIPKFNAAASKVDDGVCLVLSRPMVVSEGDGHVGCVYSVEVVLGQVAGREYP
jgi:hypothetical protein